MENQNRMISGYRDLDESEVKAINTAKFTSATVGKLIEELSASPNVDQRWLAIAKTDLQKGFMSLTRAIAKPTTF
ncbi:Acb2/Tad1 domain-containing protein [Acinetobacter brisouii]|uniref:Acb2/Tad1 domain-containing protein n=1 Tax=Acinetobacter brisouii TaxID=396323 RepID=UPI00124DE88A|nr:hypothetical protein [Acinetobacter brisouii]